MIHRNDYKRNQAFEMIFFIMSVVLLGAVSTYFLYKIINPIITYIFVIFILFMLFSFEKDSIKRKNLVYLFLATVMGAGALYFNGSGFGYLMFLIFPMFTVSLLMKISLNKRFYSSLSTIVLCSWGLAAVTSIGFRGSYIDSLMDGASVDALNPNMVALVLGSAYWFVRAWIQRSRLRGELKLPVTLGFSMVTLGCILLCRSRTSLSAFFLLVLLDGILGERMRLSKKLAYAFYWGIIMVGTLLPLGYVFLWENSTLKNISILGKSIFTGRQYIWGNLFEYMKQNPKAIWIGTDHNTDFYVMETFNLHNSYMQIFAEFGIIVFLIYFLFLFYVLARAYKDGKISQNKRNYLMMGFFLLIVGYTETILVYGLTLIFLLLSFGLLASQESWEENHAIKKNRKLYL